MIPRHEIVPAILGSMALASLGASRGRQHARAFTVLLAIGTGFIGTGFIGTGFIGTGFIGTGFIGTGLLDTGLLAPAQSATPVVFDMPAILARRASLNRALQIAMAQKRYAIAEQRAEEAVALIPFDQASYLALARAQALQGKSDAALKSLEKLLELGVSNPAALRRDPQLSSLGADERFDALIAGGSGDAARKLAWKWQVQPAAPVDGKVSVGERNTAWSSELGVFMPQFRVPAAAPEADVMTGSDEVAELLRGWSAAGTAAGNHGDFYDNFDEEHSTLDLSRFPQLTRIVYDDAVRQRGLHRGLQRHFLFRGGVVLGNSSTAITSKAIWRSQPRLAYCNPRIVQFLYTQFSNNQIYVYPEHRDHDAGHNGPGGYGDVFMANTPYVVISQGSSYTDKPFLGALAATLAAFRPEVKRRLVRNQALVPALQMILRRTYANVMTDEDYLTGRAHPTAFLGNQLNTVRMVELAHRIAPGSEPPLVRLRVVEEDIARLGRDYFHFQEAEALFDSPCAVARVHRTTHFKRRMVVSAQASSDLNGRPLAYQWRILRGDAERIELTPLNAARSIVELQIGWHPRRAVAGEGSIESNRVDIGVFVDNGEYFSPPAFVSCFYLDNEEREYDASGRLEAIRYSDDNYVDPLIDVPKAWRDEYTYDDENRLLGWERTRTSGPPGTNGPPGGRDQAGGRDQVDWFTADGYLVTSRDDAGRPHQARSVRYLVRQQGESLDSRRLVYEPGPELVTYGYDSPTDQLGTVVKRTK